ncbi:NACHT and WD40 domain protein [Aspergillus fischeri NRRL 181]|uniref:Mitochondrial division protein 1 n=1 Tax=Neosartorya fischeri (strain ATCC 1020 / DSM 3700 / CBS 544.65 / FGSC A1164 / JCM 1740 / NRRL 181 / WB 181) TaxID=331117 RepID=A1D8S6_NEOFI|nr:wd-repeat protein [Aspergillus fischeri NRRL 181]EAW20787.1 wd-repeat protein [Aspergillus fischeri NRRL 181]
MPSVKDRWKNWRARKTRSPNDSSSVVASPTPPPTDSAKVPSSDVVESPPPSHPSGKKAEVTIATSGNRQPTTRSPSKATLDVLSDTGDHAHVPRSASLVVNPAQAHPGPEEQLTKQSAVLSISQRIWNAAYDSLEEDRATTDLVKSYLKTLTAVLKAEKGSSVSAPEDDELAAQLQSPTTRQEYLKKLVSDGQKKIETSSNIKMAVGDVAQFILSAKGMIDLAIQNIPQAALPWAGVCIGLQILLNPAQATKSNLAGIAHVTSRMDWYCALTEHLLNKNNIMIGTESFPEILELLEKAVVLLYKELLLYQMKSVCFYYRHRGVGFLRGLANLDDWDGDLACVKDAEIVVREYSEQYYREYHKSSLRQLVDSGSEMEKYLGDIHQNLRDFIALQKTTRRNDEDKECLQDLFAVDPQYDLRDIEEKKDKLLDNAYDWVFSTDEYAAFTDWLDEGLNSASCRVLWIDGSAGTGKTMLFMGIIRKLSSQPSALSPSVSYFFCQGTDQTRNSATTILRSLVWQLLVQQPSLISHLRDQRRNAGAPLLRGERAFYVLSDALRSMLQDPCLSPIYFAIDALDECDRKTPGLDQLLQLIDSSLALSSKVKWLVSSRPEVLVHAGGKQLKDIHASTVSVTLDPRRLEGPVNAYIDHKLDSMKGKDGYDTDTLAQLSHEIRQRAMSTFLWVALAFKELDGVDGWDAVETIQRIPSGLSNVYELIMAQIEKGSPENQKRCKNILVAVILAYRTLSLPELAVLAGLQPKINPRTIVEKCGSFLTISGQTVSLIHQSAKDYLEANYTTKLGSDVGQGNADISARSITAMGSILRYNIYDLPYPGFETSDVTQPDPDPLAPIRYSCVFWVGHLCKAKSQGFGNDLTEGGAVLRFFKEHFLHWLEALSLVGGISESIRLLKELQTAVDSANDTELSAFLRDMHRFIRFFRQVIDVAPLQAYYSGLVFAPQRSLVRQTFEKFLHTRISHIPIPQLDWSPRLYTLDLYETTPESVAFSEAGDRLASGLKNGLVKIWDTATGGLMQILQGHDDMVNSVAFSRDGNLLASGSRDHTIKIWDTVTGDCVQILGGHNGPISSVSFSATSEQLASGSSDETIKIWDVVAGKCVQTVEVNYAVHSVAFSNADARLAAGLDGGSAIIWDTATDTQMHKLGNYRAFVESVAFSADDERLASGESHGTIKIWDTATGACLHTLHGHEDAVFYVGFLRGTDRLASGSFDGTVKIWDPAIGKCMRTLVGHSTGKISSLSFSATGDQLASAGFADIEIWDMAIVNNTTPVQSRQERVKSVTFSASGHRLVSLSWEGTMWIWDTVTGKCICTLERPVDGPSVASVAFSMAGDRVASGLFNGDIKIWDTVTGRCMQTFKHQGYNFSWVQSVAFSATGEQLASCSMGGDIKIWNTGTGKCMQTLDHFQVTLVAFSPTGERLAAGLRGGVIKMWRTVSRYCMWRIRGHSRRLTSLAFSGSGNQLASASEDFTMKVWNTATGDCIQMFNVGTSICQLLFDPTSTCLVTEIGRIKVDLSSFVPAMTSEAGDMAEDQTYLDQESREVQEGLNGEVNDDEWQEQTHREFEPESVAERGSGEVGILASNNGLSEEELFEEREPADYVSVDEQSAADELADEKSADKETDEEELSEEESDEEDLAPVSAAYYSETKVYGYGLPDRPWTTRDGQDFIWLPPEFRPECSAVQGDTVAIGCRSGQVLIFGFAPDGYSADT